MRIAFLILVAACSSHPSPSPRPSPGPVASATASKSVISAKDLGPLAARLQYEAAHRPASGLRAERVLDAIDAAGLALADRRQFLGLTAHASYCAGGTTKDGTGISICEYESPAAATAAKAYVDRQYAIADATRTAHGSALLTVVGTRDAADRAARAFEAL